MVEKTQWIEKYCMTQTEHEEIYTAPGEIKLKLSALQETQTTQPLRVKEVDFASYRKKTIKIRNQIWYERFYF